MDKNSHDSHKIATLRVYLAGTMESDWREIVKKASPRHTYYDPGIDSDQRYACVFAQQDLAGIDGAHLVFAYETNHPVSLGTAAEMGYAFAKGKRIIYVDERKEINLFLASLSERTFSDLTAGIEYLTNIEERA